MEFGAKLYYLINFRYLCSLGQWLALHLISPSHSFSLLSYCLTILAHCKPFHATRNKQIHRRITCWRNPLSRLLEKMRHSAAGNLFFFLGGGGEFSDSLPATWLIPQSAESNPHHHITFKNSFNIILPSIPRSSRWSLSLNSFDYDSECLPSYLCIFTASVNNSGL